VVAVVTDVVEGVPDTTLTCIGRYCFLSTKLETRMRSRELGAALTAKKVLRHTKRVKCTNRAIFAFEMKFRPCGKATSLLETPFLTPGLYRETAIRARALFVV
jgi:hypothetical protein